MSRSSTRDRHDTTLEQRGFDRILVEFECSLIGYWLENMLFEKPRVGLGLFLLYYFIPIATTEDCNLDLVISITFLLHLKLLQLNIHKSSVSMLSSVTFDAPDSYESIGGNNMMK